MTCMNHKIALDVIVFGQYVAYELRDIFFFGAGIFALEWVIIPKLAEKYYEAQKIKSN